MKIETLVAKAAEFAATGPVLKRLIDLGLLVQFTDYEDHNDSVTGHLVNPKAFCIMLGADPRFKRDIWNFLHSEIKDPTGFREYKVYGRKGSTQIIVGEKDGRKDYCHVDIDAHNTQDLFNIVAHLTAGVIFKRRA